MTAAVAKNRQPWTMVPAADLCAQMIGRLVRVRTWDATREVATVQTGELRQISANASAVTVHIGLMAEVEVSLDPDQPVTIDPPASYADVTDLAQYDHMTDSRN
ncbi:hypothetical protein PBI_INDLOVU_60 [Mycobacterium phage Indlovu]|nr:hypothetical protein PBI_INDLOVU_60 [Mycobacterium phage Indlovu]